MPDLPSRLCAKCAYKAKIFYLLTRQFVLGQYAMRATITEWYHNKYNIEPPEQVDDQKRFQKQLSEAVSPPLPALIATTSSESDNRLREMVEKKPLLAAVTLAQGELKRSISEDNRLGGGAVAATVQLARRNGPQINVQRNLDEGQMTRSAMNLKFPGKGRIPVRKLPQVGVAAIYRYIYYFMRISHTDPTATAAAECNSKCNTRTWFNIQTQRNWRSQPVPRHSTHK